MESDLRLWLEFGKGPLSKEDAMRMRKISVLLLDAVEAIAHGRLNGLKPIHICKTTLKMSSNTYEGKEAFPERDDHQ